MPHGLLCLIASVSLVAVAFAQPHQRDTGCEPVPSVLSQPQAKAPADKPAKSIPFDQLRAEAQKQYPGEGIAITPTADGQPCTPPSKNSKAKPSARAYGSPPPPRPQASPSASACSPPQQAAQTRRCHLRHSAFLASEGKFSFIHPGIVEEYSVSMT